MNISSIEDIPEYYFDSPILNSILNTINFKKLTFNEFKETESFQLLRDDSIIKDDEDFIFSLESFQYYDVQHLPDHVLDYIISHESGLFTLPDDLIDNNQLIKNWNEDIFNYVLNLFYEGKIFVSDFKDDNFRLKFVKYLNRNNMFIAVSAGEYHTSAIKVDRTLVSWGDNDENQCDNIPSGEYIAVSSGEYHTSAIKVDGTLVSWGDNDENQCDNIPPGIFLF